MLKLSSKAIEEMGHFLNDNAELIQRAQPWLERAKFDAMIERIGAFPELLRPDGTLYETPFYRAESGMLWAALLLAPRSQR